jgi:hypothetical protein
MKTKILLTLFFLSSSSILFAQLGNWFDDGGGGNITSIGGGVSVYPATATASFPYGFDLNTFWGKNVVGYGMDGTGAVNFGGPSVCRAPGNYATIGGGDDNTALSHYSTSAGGYNNDAVAIYATVSGGSNNVAGGEYSTISGGDTGQASGYYATVGGGYGGNASGNYSTSNGGYNNVASGANSSIGGGYNNIANETYSTIGGGFGNHAYGPNSVVIGGTANTASGNASVALGGASNIVSGAQSLAAGSYANATHIGTFVWADAYTATPFSSIADNEFAVQATNGMRVVGSGILTTTFTATNAIKISTTSAAPTSEPGYAFLFSTGAASAEMWVIDGAGNTTQISPHDQETGVWKFLSCNEKTGRCYEVPSMEALINTVEELSGKRLHREWNKR